MTKLLIATNNDGKLREFQDLLKGFDFVTPAQLNLTLDVTEDGETYAANASKKALAFNKASGLICIADDSGLEVDALNGAPGLYSKRYGPSDDPWENEALSDADRRTYLLKNLLDAQRPWTARFRATIAIALPADYAAMNSVKTPALFEGVCDGEIIPEEHGTNGFGYDPIFLLNEVGKTMAELTTQEKNLLSHRARAVINSKRLLESLVEQTDNP